MGERALICDLTLVGCNQQAPAIGNRGGALHMTDDDG